MQHTRPILRLVIVACLSAPTLHARSSSTPPQTSSATSVPDFSRERTLIDEGSAARKRSDYTTARAKAQQAVTSLIARPNSEQNAAWLAVLDSAARLAGDAQDASAARIAWQRVFDVRSRTLPDDDPDLQAARGNLASTLRSLGDLAGARVLQEKVLEVRSRTLPEDHHDLQAARGNLAETLRELGDLAGARALEEKLVDVWSRTLPDDHPDLQGARGNLGATLFKLGDFTGARALHERVLEVQTRTLSDDDLALQLTRHNVALDMYALGDIAGARALLERAVVVFARRLPDDHPDLQNVKVSLAGMILALGDIAVARSLTETVLDVWSRTLPDDHPALQMARSNVAIMLYAQGDLAAARALCEKVLEVRSRTLPDDHPDLQTARQNLASMLLTQGDLPGARALYEKVLEVDSRTLPDDHPALQKARLSVASTLRNQGDLHGARALYEKALEADSRTLPDDHPDLQSAREGLAMTMIDVGDLADARALGERVLEVCLRTLSDDRPEVQVARLHLAGTIACQIARAGRAAGSAADITRKREAERSTCAELVGASCRAQVRAARAAILASSGREAEERCSTLMESFDMSLSFARGLGVFEPLRILEAELFVLAETTRGAAIVSAELTRRGASSPKYKDLHSALRAACEELAALAQNGTTSEAFDRARTKRESVERELVELARELAGEQSTSVDFGAESLAARLGERDAAVGFRRFKSTRVDVVDELDSTGQPAVRTSSIDRLCAFVVHAQPGATRDASSELALVDLGPMAAIEDAVRAWREAIGVGVERGTAVANAETDTVKARGDELRKLVFDPLLTAIGTADRLVIALDDVLHLVPLDALPLAASNERLGDRWRIETRSTLTELLADSPESTGSALVALGGASFNVSPSALSAQDAASIEEEQPTHVATLLRGSAWERGFAPLTHSAEEARGIGALYTEIFEDTRPTLVLEKRTASREALEEFAPKARFVHIATHGWFAPESIRSWNDLEPLDKKSGLGARRSGAEQVKGMSPMLLCGLALAGANLPEDAVGRAPGLITADELSTLDLSNCELVVLSACDTNVGERRAGQGVASLQKALQMAGARSVITSLWKVPDEATKELMLDFYRRLWVEKKPKHQALWEAKTKLREAKDERGAPKYSTRDWAAWVLTGDPR